MEVVSQRVQVRGAVWERVGCWVNWRCFPCTTDRLSLCRVFLHSPLLFPDRSNGKFFADYQTKSQLSFSDKIG